MIGYESGNWELKNAGTCPSQTIIKSNSLPEMCFTQIFLNLEVIYRFLTKMKVINWEKKYEQAKLS